MFVNKIEENFVNNSKTRKVSVNSVYSIEQGKTDSLKFIITKKVINKIILVNHFKKNCMLVESLKLFFHFTLAYNSLHFL